jgi:3-dehydroquinate synthase
MVAERGEPRARHAPPAPGLRDAAGGRLAYPVWVGAGALDRLGAVVAAAAPAHRYAIVTDETVAARHGARAAAALAPHVDAAPLIIAVPPGEAHKTRDTWARVTDELLAAGYGRDTTIVALGGGVVGDLAGFVAATYLRGVPVVQAPSTLLAMVDASVGGKTAVDTPAGKNLVGAFHPPAAVLVDPTLLGTLPPADLAAGAAEALKHGVIADARHFGDAAALLPALASGAAAGDPAVLDGLARVVADSVAIKAAVVAEDPREHGRRKTLNLGHTVGHAVELAAGYRIRHGEAVALGHGRREPLAERLGVAAAGTADARAAACAAGGLPVAPRRARARGRPRRARAATRRRAPGAWSTRSPRTSAGWPTPTAGGRCRSTTRWCSRCSPGSPRPPGGRRRWRDAPPARHAARRGRRGVGRGRRARCPRPGGRAARCEGPLGPPGRAASRGLPPVAAAPPAAGAARPAGRRRPAPAADAARRPPARPRGAPTARRTAPAAGRRATASRCRARRAAARRRPRRATAPAPPAARACWPGSRRRSPRRGDRARRARGARGC